MMCMRVVLIVPLRFLCHCGKLQLCLLWREQTAPGEDNAGPGKLRGSLRGPAQELGCEAGRTGEGAS